MRMSDYMDLRTTVATAAAAARARVRHAVTQDIAYPRSEGQRLE